MRTSTSDKSDSYDDHYKIVAVSDVLDWLKDSENYAEAQCWQNDEGEVIVAGEYSFCDRFIAYPTSESFQAAVKRLVNREKPPVEVPHMDLSAHNVAYIHQAPSMIQ